MTLAVITWGDRATSMPTCCMMEAYSLRPTRTKVFLTPNRFARRATRRLSLSSLVRQTMASASPAPSCVNRSMSVPSPFSTIPWFKRHAVASQRSSSRSMIFTEIPFCSNNTARLRPTRPAPMIITRSTFERLAVKLPSKSTIASCSPMKKTWSSGRSISLPLGIIILS